MDTLLVILGFVFSIALIVWAFCFESGKQAAVVLITSVVCMAALYFEFILTTSSFWLKLLFAVLLGGATTIVVVYVFLFCALFYGITRRDW